MEDPTCRAGACHGAVSVVPAFWDQCVSYQCQKYHIMWDATHPEKWNTIKNISWTLFSIIEWLEAPEGELRDFGWCCLWASWFLSTTVLLTQSALLTGFVLGKAHLPEMCAFARGPRTILDDQECNCVPVPGQVLQLVMSPRKMSLRRGCGGAVQRAEPWNLSQHCNIAKIL